MTNPNYIETTKYIEITIHKPLYGTFCFIREHWVNRAKKNNKPLKLILPQGEAIMTADQWLNNAQRIEKVFLRPDQPMVLYGNYAMIPDIKPYTPPEIKEDAQLPLF